MKLSSRADSPIRQQDFTYVLCSLCVHTMKGRMEYISHPNTSEGDTGSKLTKKVTGRSGRQGVIAVSVSMAIYSSGSKLTK